MYPRTKRLRSAGVETIPPDAHAPEGLIAVLRSSGGSTLTSKPWMNGSGIVDVDGRLVSFMASGV